MTQTTTQRTRKKEHEHFWELYKSYRGSISDGYNPRVDYEIYVFTCKKGCGEIKEKKIYL